MNPQFGSNWSSYQLKEILWKNLQESRFFFYRRKGNSDFELPIKISFFRKVLKLSYRVYLYLIREEIFYWKKSRIFKISSIKSYFGWLHPGPYTKNLMGPRIPVSTALIFSWRGPCVGLIHARSGYELPACLLSLTL